MSWIPQTTVDQILEWLPNQVDGNGLLITSLDSFGKVTDPEPLIGDYGDILPFFLKLGRPDFVDDQIRRSAAHLHGGMVKAYGSISAFHNHDWLLGLLDLHCQLGLPELLTLASKAADSLWDLLAHRGHLLDRSISLKSPRTWLASAAPFNGGYIELFVELHRLGAGEKWLARAQSLAKAWIATRDFQSEGIFSRQLTLWNPALNEFLIRRSQLRARLFKDNTNTVWGLLSLWLVEPEAWLRDALLRWLQGFSKHFWNDGRAALMLRPEWTPTDISLKAAFSALDLLSDLAAANIERASCLGLGQGIIKEWRTQQWEDGRFPEIWGGARDHLDANTDMAVALAKYSSVSGDTDAWECGRRCARGLVASRKWLPGLVNQLGRDGSSSGGIVIKYQALLLKLALLPVEPTDLYRDPQLLSLLRDR